MSIAFRGIKLNSGGPACRMQSRAEDDRLLAFSMDANKAQGTGVNPARRRPSARGDEILSEQQNMTDLSRFIAENFGANATYVEGLLSRFRNDPALVDESWRTYFNELLGGASGAAAIQTHENGRAALSSQIGGDGASGATTAATASAAATSAAPAPSPTSPPPPPARTE